MQQTKPEYSNKELGHTPAAGRRDEKTTHKKESQADINVSSSVGAAMSTKKISTAFIGAAVNKAITLNEDDMFKTVRKMAVFIIFLAWIGDTNGAEWHSQKHRHTTEHPMEYNNKKILDNSSKNNKDCVKLELGQVNIRARREANDTHTGIELIGDQQEFIQFPQNIAKRFMTAEHTQFDFTRLMNQMSSVQKELKKYSRIEFEALDTQISLSQKYQDFVIIDRSITEFVFATIRSQMTFEQCETFCRVKDAKMVYNFTQLIKITEAFNTTFTDYWHHTNIHDWGETGLPDGIWLSYRFKDVDSYNIYPTSIATGRQYLYDKDTVVHKGVKYPFYRAKVSTPHVQLEKNHFFGSLDLNDRCTNKDSPILFNSNDFVGLTDDKRHVFKRLGKFTPLEPLYSGIVNKTDPHNIILSCKALGYKATGTATRRQTCACVAHEDVSHSEAIHDELTDVVENLEAHFSQEVIRNGTTRNKRFLWPLMPTLARFIFPMIASVTLKSVKRKMVRRAVVDASQGVVKTFGRALTEEMTMGDRVRKVTMIDTNPPTATKGHKIASGGWEVNSKIIKHLRENNKVKFFNRFTSLTGFKNHYQNIVSLLRQANMLQDTKHRIMTLVTNGAFSNMESFTKQADIVSSNQITTENQYGEKPSARHILTQMIQEPPERKMKTVSLPTHRLYNGDMVYYDIGSDCAFDVNARSKKHSCKKVSGEFNDIQTIKSAAHTIVIVTDRYPDLTLECEEYPKYIKNKGLVVLQISGQFRLRYQQGAHIESKDTLEETCTSKIILNKSLGTAPMDNLEKRISKAMKALGITKDSQVHHVAVIIIIAVMTTAMIVITYLGVYKYTKYRIRLKSLIVSEEENNKNITQNQSFIGNVRDMLPQLHKEVRRIGMGIENIPLIEDNINKMDKDVNKLSDQLNRVSMGLGDAQIVLQQTGPTLV